MTKSEYNRRLAIIQAKLTTNNNAEDVRHNTAVGAIRNEYRREVGALRDEFTASASDVDLREMGTGLRAS